MADSFTQVAPDSTGDKVDGDELTVGANTVIRQRVQVAGAAAAEIVDVANAEPGASDYGIVARTLPVPMAKLSASGTIDLVDEVVVLEILGRPYCMVKVVGALTANMLLIAEVSADGGVAYNERLIFNGDNLVAADVLPHPTEDIRTYRVELATHDTHVRVRALLYTSGSVTATVTAGPIGPNQPLISSLGFQAVPTTLGAVNDDIEVYGGLKHAVGFFIEAGTLAGTLVVEVNPYSHGNSGAWKTTTFFAGSSWRQSWAVTNPNSAGDIVVAQTPSAQRYRLRVSAYTSGSAVAHGRASLSANDIGMALAAGVPGQPVPIFAGYQGVKDGATLRAALGDVEGRQYVRITPATDFTAVHTPAANTQATATKAAGGAGVRNVCTGITVVFGADATAPTAISLTVALRDGATGAGTILWQARISLPAVAGAMSGIALSGLHIRGTANTAMTLEFSAAGGANTLQSVTLLGHTITEA